MGRLGENCDGNFAVITLLLFSKLVVLIVAIIIIIRIIMRKHTLTTMTLTTR